MSAFVPEYEPMVGILPHGEDYEARLAAAKTLQKFMRELHGEHWHMTANLFAAFLILPLEHLQSGVEDEVSMLFLNGDIGYMGQTMLYCKSYLATSCHYSDKC